MHFYDLCNKWSAPFIYIYSLIFSTGSWKITQDQRFSELAKWYSVCTFKDEGHAEVVEQGLRSQLKQWCSKPLRKKKFNFFFYFFFFPSQNTASDIVKTRKIGLQWIRILKRAKTTKQ